jgi:hypothetical protein
MKKIISLIFILLLTSCLDKKTTPESALNSFIKDRFSGKSLEDLKDRITSDFYKEFTEGENDIKESNIWVLKDQSLKKFKVLNKACEETSCQITYFISYFTNDGKKKAFLTETKKIAQMELKDEKWLIKSITHLKTYHDSLQNL